MPQLESILHRIEAALQSSGRRPNTVRLIGVSKKQGPEKILAAAAAGLWDFGENYVQEWEKKDQKIRMESPQLAAKLRWHFIGHLQSNKVNKVVGRVETIQTVDRLKLAKKISEIAGNLQISQKVFAEVNVGQETGKSGFSPKDFLSTWPDLASLPHLSWQGLMCIPPAAEAPEKSRPFFRQLKSLLDECNHSGLSREPLRELSMGMSRDFEVAIEEGATMVRIGTALFGSRS